MAVITGSEHSFAHRTTMISYAISTAVLSVGTVFVTPQLKSVILKLWQRNRVVPIRTNVKDSIQIRTIATIK
jgi:hypothetical protein